MQSKKSYHIIVFFKTIALLFVLAGLTLNLHAQKVDSIPVTPIYKLQNKSAQYPVLYGKQSDTTVVGAIGYLKGNALQTSPSNFILYPLTGRIAGFNGVQISGEPGSENIYRYVRGVDGLLVLIDGIPRAATTLNPEQVESMTLLKDALSTAMLGNRAKNGVLLITTKKGIPGSDYFKLNVKAETGVQSPVKIRKTLDAFDYASLYNEALANDGKSPLYTPSDLDAYKNHTDPLGHPDVDWYNTILKKNSIFNRYTVNAEGAAKFGNYFVSLDYLNQNGLFKESDKNSYSTNSSYKRYVFRSNLNININQDFTVYLNLLGRIQQDVDPRTGSSTILNGIISTPSNAYPVFVAPDSLAGNRVFNQNLYGMSVYSGYSQTNTRDGFADFGFNLNLNNVVKGWWLKGVSSFNTSVAQTSNRSKQFLTFERTATPGKYTIYGSNNSADLVQGNSFSIGTNTYQFYSELSTGINRTFNNQHLGFTVLASRDENQSLLNLSQTYLNLAARLNYDISKKYLFEATGSYSGDNWLKPGKQAGFFPAVGLGWNMAQENFMKEVKFVNALKIRASYGLVGFSNAGYYLYQQAYVGTGSYYFGTPTPTAITGLKQDVFSSERTFEKATKLNLGADINFADNRGWITFDYFLTKQKDLLQAPGNISAVIGNPLPSLNQGKNQFSGIETSIGWASRQGRSFSYDISANFSTSQSKLNYNGVNYLYPNQNRIGLPVAALFGYVADGFVTKAGQGPVIEGYTAVPGDIKYKDLNNDGKINQFDVTSISSNKPLIYYGLTANFRYKKAYISILFQGVANNEINLNNSALTFEFQNGGIGQAYPENLNRWTPETAATATYPRVSVGTNPNNTATSNFWLTNGDYFRLKNVELGYNFSGKMLQKAKLSNVRVFVNGLNLFTVTKFKQFDPEMPLANYSLQRVFNGGVSVTF